MEISLKESQWRSRSLLNRNAEGYYKFSHKSVLEYFLAKEAIENPSFTGRLKFEGLDAAKRFCEEMVFGKMLKNSEGTFTLLNIGKEQPFKQLNKRNQDKIVTLKIKSGNSLNLQAIRFLKSSNVKKIMIKDFGIFPNLYELYSSSDVFKLQVVQELQVLLNLRELLKPQKQEEQQKRIKNLNLLLGRHEQRERLTKLLQESQLRLNHLELQIRKIRVELPIRKGQELRLRHRPLDILGATCVKV
ncbi:MAG: hypothetical protein J5I98_05440 [Phaeodactylibacter sp.]|nr:hypothetical protein [Phaeodactylibacter sp.]